MELSLTAARAVFPENTVTDAGMVDANQSTPVKAPEQSKWILNCPLDLFFVCGGAMWLICFCAIPLYLISNSQAHTFLSLVLIGGALIFADSHNAATIVRFIDEPGLAARHPYVSVLLPALMVLCVLPSLLGSSEYLAYGMKLYLILIAQHVTAQAYGITMIYLRKTGLELSSRQVGVIKIAFTAMMISGIARQFSVVATYEMMGVQVPYWPILPDLLNFVLGLIAVFASLVMFVVIRIQAQKSGKSIHPGAVLLAGNTLLLYTIGPVVGIFALLAPAFFHGTQYLAVTTAHTMKQRSSDTSLNGAPHLVTPRLLTGENTLYWTKVLTLGAVLYIVFPMALYRAGFSPIAAMAAVFCTVNFHHFAADAVIWRRRNA